MLRYLALGVLLVTSGFLGGLGVGTRTARSPDIVAFAETPPAASTAPALAPRPFAPMPAADEGGALPDLTAVARRTIRAVTNIASLQVVRTRSPFFDDPFFRRFFGDEDLFGFGERRGTSAGSGVIVSSDGLILTNNHVIGNQVQQLTVSLADNREREARVVGVDPWTDLALLQIDETDLPTIPWGDSSQLEVAEWVLAIGNPFQLNHTVTLGIVSALGRANVNIAAYEDFIQTDAAINPGNSGGALINQRGELVGINTAILTNSGGYEGVGFAVPSNLARRIMDELVEHGQVRRGSIGQIRTVDLTAALARDLQLDAREGALVWEMARRSAAYQAGVRPGDLIVGFDGEAVADAAQFSRLLLDAPIGSVVTLDLLRRGERVQVKVPVSQAELGARG